MENSKLPEGIKQCKHCKGAGFVSMTENEMYVKSCPVCKGKGNVDWITYAVGYVEPPGKAITFWPAIPSSNVVSKPNGPPKTKVKRSKVNEQNN